MSRLLHNLFSVARRRLSIAMLLGAAASGLSSCDTTTKQAVGCNTSSDCPGGQICGSTGQCLPKPKSLVLTLTKLGEGIGSVKSTPAGIDCGTTCSASFDVGTPITLTATAQSGSLVSGFSIGCSSTDATCTFTPTTEDPVQVGVNFALAPPSQPPPLCNSYGFCWENPRPQGNKLNDVAVLPSGEVWAVGDAGTVVRRVGTTNTLLSSGTTQALYGAAVVGTDVVIVGQGGTAMRGAGSAVTTESSGVVQDLYDVGATSAGAVAVGAGGKILRRSGIAWTGDTSPTTQALRGVSVTGTDIYAVGDAGTVLANSGAAWRVVSDAQFGSKALSSVAGLGGAAYIGSVTGEIFRQGSPWSRVCCNNLPDITGMTSSSFGLLAVGFTVGGSILQSSDGMTWNTAVDGASTLLYGVAATTGEAWAVGDAGTMRRSTDGLSWPTISTGATGLIRAVAGTTAGYYAAGQSGVLLRSVGTAVLSYTAAGTPDFFGVSAASPTEAWAVGDVGTIYQFNGTAWQKVVSGTGSALRAVWAAGPGDAWAVGDAGTVVHVKNGSASSMSGGTTQNLLSVWGVSATDIWAVGAAGTVVRYQGSSFAPVTAPATTRAISSVWGNLASNVWMVAGPDVFVWNGNNYQKYTPSLSDMTAVGGFSTEVYVTGSKGQLYRYAGPGFTSVETGTRNNLYGIALSATSMWLVGDNGSVLSKLR